jgi:hypothetical protein
VDTAASSLLLFEAQDLPEPDWAFQQPQLARTLPTQKFNTSDGFVDINDRYHSKQPEWIRKPPTIDTFSARRRCTNSGSVYLDIWRPTGIRKCRSLIRALALSNRLTRTVENKEELQAPKLIPRRHRAITGVVEQLDMTLQTRHSQNHIREPK